MLNQNTGSAVIAERAPLPPEGQEAVLERPDLRTHLAHNPNVKLTDSVWKQLWEPKPPARDALALVLRELTAEQVAWVLDNESRSTVLAGVFELSEVSEEQIVALLSGRRAKVAAKALPADYPLSPQLWDRVTSLVGGIRRLEYLAVAPETSFDEARTFIGALTDTSAPKPSAERSRYFTQLLCRFPDLVDDYTQPGAIEALATVAAGSWHLDSEKLQRRIADRIDSPGPTGVGYDGVVTLAFTLMAFAANPVVDPAIVDEVARRSAKDRLLARVPDACHRRTSDPDRPQIVGRIEDVKEDSTLDWLVRRMTPFYGQNFSNRGRPFDLELLAYNPHLGTERAQRVVDGLADFAVAEVLGAERTAAAIAAACANHPTVESPDTQALASAKAPIYPLRPRTVAPLQPGTCPEPPEGSSVWHLTFGWRAHGVLQWLTAPGVVASRDAWRVLLTLLDDAGQDDFVPDLVAAANVLA
jgi:hypothetical protein